MKGFTITTSELPRQYMRLAGKRVGDEMLDAAVVENIIGHLVEVKDAGEWEPIAEQQGIRKQRKLGVLPPRAPTVPLMPEENPWR